MLFYVDLYHIIFFHNVKIYDICLYYHQPTVLATTSVNRPLVMDKLRQPVDDTEGGLKS